MEQKMDQLADDGAVVLLVGLSSADWERVRDRFADWFERRGQDDYVGELRSLRGPLESDDAMAPWWRRGLSEGLADAWDLDGSDELTSLIREFDMLPYAEKPTAAPVPVTSGDRFD